MVVASEDTDPDLSCIFWPKGATRRFVRGCLLLLVPMVLIPRCRVVGLHSGDEPPSPEARVMLSPRISREAVLGPMVRGTISLTSFYAVVRFFVTIRWLIGLRPSCVFHMIEP